MKNKIKVIASVLVFCILFVGCGKLLRYILTDDVGAYTRVTFHEMYEQDNIDILFVGSSHCYRSFIPEILDKELGLNTFNAGSSGQQMDGSLIVIKEAAKYNDISHVYLEVFYSIALDPLRKNRTNLTSTYLISDYIKPSIDKFFYLIEASGDEHYMNSFVVARRNSTKLLDFKYMKNVIEKKNSDAYKNYSYSNITNDTEWYAGKGYVANNNIVNNWDFFNMDGWENINLDSVSDDWLNSLTDIIDFCSENGIELTLITAPMPNFLIAGLGNYDQYIDLINSIIEGTDVNFYDFNLCKETYFPNTSSLFADFSHINCYGAETFSYCFAKLVNGEVSPQDMFYDSYSEKLANLEPTVFGVSYRNDMSDDGTNLINCKIVSSDNLGMEYAISFIPDEGEEYSIRDYSDEEYFIISPVEKGACIIRYRMHDNIEIEYEVSISI